MSDSRYLTAQVCPNGHVVTSSLEWGDMNSPFCPECGKPTVTACECGTPIRGLYHVPGFVGVGEKYTPPAYCYSCGKPFPWTQQRLDAARELIDESEGLSDDEKAALSGTLDDLLSDTPKTEVAALKFKRLAAKTGVEVAGALRSVLVDVMSEAARKAVFGA